MSFYDRNINVPPGLGVKAFGNARGNDIDDDTASFVATYAACVANHLPMIVEPGIYKITAPLTWDRRIWVYGCGMSDDGTGSRSRIKKYGNFTGITISAPGEASIGNFTLDSNGAPDASPGIVITGVGAAGFEFRNIEIRNQGSHGLRIQFCNLALFSNIMAVASAGDGVRIDPGPAQAVNANTFINFNCSANTGNGFHIISDPAGFAESNFGFGIVCQNNGVDGFRITRGSRNIFFVYLETNAAKDLSLLANSQFSLMFINNIGAFPYDVGTQNSTVDFGSGLIKFGFPLTPYIQSANVAGQDSTFNAGDAGPGAAAHAGGILAMRGGDAAGAPGNADGGYVHIRAGEGIGAGGNKGLLTLQRLGGNTIVGSDVPAFVNGLLQLISTTKAFVPPIMTTAQKNAIVGAGSGMVVYDSTLNKLCVYGAAGWQTITSV